MQRIWSMAPVIGMTLAWIIPLHLLPWVSWHGEVPVFAGVFLAAVAACWTAVGTQGPQTQLKVPSMALAFTAIAGLACLQAATGLMRYWGDALTLVIYMMLCAAAFLLAYHASRDSAIPDALAWTLLVAGVGCTVIALVQALDLWGDNEWIARTPSLRRPGSNLAQPNQMATLVLMAAASLLYLHDRFKIGSKPSGLVAVTLCLGLVTTESRTGLLSLVALVGWWWLHRRAQSRTTTLAAVGLVVLVLLGYAFWPALLMGFHGLDADSARVNTQAGLRLVVWPQLLEAAAQRPWFGWGLRGTSAALSSVVAQHAVSEPYTFAHNVVLDLLLGTGAPLTLLAVGAAVAWVWRRRAAAADLTGWYCMALWVPLGLHAMLEFPHAYAYMLAPAMLALGLLDERFGRASVCRVSAIVAAVVTTLGVAIALWSAVEYVQVEEDFRVARFEAGRIGTTPSDYERPQLHLMTQLAALLDAARIDPHRGMSAAELALARDASLRFPWPALQNRYALALALSGRGDAAVRELKVIRVMHGEIFYKEIRLNWKSLAADKYPELSQLHIP